MRFLPGPRQLIPLGMALLLFIYLLGTIDPAAPSDYDYRFTFISPMTSWSNIAAAIREADEALCVHTKLYGSERMNVETQTQTIREAIYAQPNGIITAASVQSDELREAINLAEAKGVPVILIDSDLPDSNRTTYIGTDNLAAGRLAGQDMFNATGGTARIGLIVSDMQYPNQQERVQGFMEEIAQHPGMQIVATAECYSDKLDVMEKVPKLLTDHPDIDALFITEAIASSMVGSMIQEAPFCDRHFSIVAFDNVAPTRAFVESGLYVSLIAQTPAEQGTLAVQTLKRILDGEAVPSIIYTPALSIKKDDLGDAISNRSGEVEWILY